MPYIYEIPTNVSTPDALIGGIVSNMPFLVPLTLFFIWFFIFFSGVNRQSSRLGQADYPFWALMASLSTLIVSLILSLTSGFINIDWLSILVVVNLLCAIWLFLDRRVTEV
ncbi:MAG: hypothetical protein KatS3mg096_708 [Candidatus Parcubacteria bacterium]|nr:MAG: hypothetical protein KatS3mg096_681 [Candidatus Parcubacteria bacterium]GIW67840.1 MAG: hypothetical protein KatS3mg096_708 [Candidatus Parcubacteria bacterium]